jgi:RNA binding exosome subunit
MNERIVPATIRVETLCHATEDQERVSAIFSLLVPPEETKLERLYGHYKNRILKLSYCSSKKEGVIAFLSKIPAGFAPDIEGKKATIYLRKDALCGGEWRPAEQNEPAVFVEIGFKVFGGNLSEEYFLRRGWQ